MKATGIMEKRALAFCQRVKERGYGSFVCRKTRSKISNNLQGKAYGEKIACMTGCGYNKEAALLADVLRWMGETEKDWQTLWIVGEGGFHTIRGLLAPMGWDLLKEHESESGTIFRIERA